MKSIYTLAALALFGIASAQTTSISNFKNLAVNGDINLTLVKSNENKLVINADDEDVEVDQESDMLSISGEGNVTLYYKNNIETLAASEDCVIKGQDAITGKTFTLVAASDAKVTLEVKVDKLNTVATEDAVVILSGFAKEHTVAMESDAVLKASALETDVTSVTASSDAKASVKAKKTVNALADSDAVIEIYGNPEKINQSANDDGVVRKV